MNPGELSRLVVVRCASCPATSAHETTSLRKAITWFTSHGWGRRPWKFYCPACCKTTFTNGDRKSIRLTRRVRTLESGGTVSVWQWVGPEGEKYSPPFMHRRDADQYPITMGFRWGKWEG